MIGETVSHFKILKKIGEGGLWRRIAITFDASHKPHTMQQLLAWGRP